MWSGLPGQPIFCSKPPTALASPGRSHASPGMSHACWPACVPALIRVPFFVTHHLSPAHPLRGSRATFLPEVPSCCPQLQRILCCCLLPAHTTSPKPEENYIGSCFLLQLLVRPLARVKSEYSALLLMQNKANTPKRSSPIFDRYF